MKKRKQITCPHGGAFATDWFEFKECDGCKFAKECEDEWEKRKWDREQKAENKKLKKRRKREKSQRPKTKDDSDDIKDDQRGNYTTREDTKLLLFGTKYPYCILVFHYLMYKSFEQIDKRPHLTLEDIAKELGIGRGTVYNAITILLKKGLIRRTPRGKDVETGRWKETYIFLNYEKRPSKFIIENAEYLKVIDELVEEGVYWINAFTSEKAKREVLEVKYKKLRHKYRELKRK